MATRRKGPSAPKNEQGSVYVHNPEYFHHNNSGKYDVVLAAKAFDSIELSEVKASPFDESYLTLELTGDRLGNRSLNNPVGRPQALLWQCNEAYKGVDVIHNVIDMMSSFGSRGVKVVHPVRSREKLYQQWFDKVKGKDRSQAFLSILFRMGTVFIKRDMDNLTQADFDDLRKGFASSNLGRDGKFKPLIHPTKNQIPVNYTFLNPCSMETVHGELATFLGEPIYILRIPQTMITYIKTPKTPDQEQLVARLPAYIRDPIKAGQLYVMLTNDQMAVYHYMKDDWEQFATPMLYSILPQIDHYRKLQKADMAALEGVISQVRLWKIGNTEKGLQPGPAAFAKLQEMLQHVGKGGSMDLVWDDNIDFKESSTNMHQFLGIGKYEPVLRAIYGGLGIPQSLTGGEEAGAGFTNNAISIKILVERLQYGRDKLMDFWRNELRIFQEAVGDKKPATIIFDDMNLFDDANEKNLWIALLEHNVISPETLQEKFGLVPEIEEQRMRRSMKRVASGKAPKPQGPYDVDKEHELAKTALGQGTVSPTEVGVKKLPKAKGDKSLLDQQRLLDQQKAKDTPTGNGPGSPKKPKGKPGQGRPKGKTDSVKRKTKVVSPRSKADLSEWATEAYGKINEFVVSSFLRRCMITSEDLSNQFDLLPLANIKLNVMMHTEPYAEISEEYVDQMITSLADCVDDIQPSLPVYSASEFINDEVVIDKYVELNLELD